MCDNPKPLLDDCIDCQNFKFFYHNFPRYTEIQIWLQWLAKQFPHMVRVEIIGQSVQDRDIYMIIIKGCTDIKRISVMLEAGIHAREWISITTALYCISYIVRHPSLLNFADFYIIPCLNPDGYEYTHTCNRLWRKNLNKNHNEDEECWGVDLNRNFSYRYGTAGSSGRPSSSVYRGENSLSEPEAQSLANTLCKYGKYIQLYIAIHAFGSLIMYPWGYTYQPICDAQELQACGEAALRAMRNYQARCKFKVGQLSDVMYISSGGSSDYARGVHNIKFSYTIELHRGGRSGFEPRKSRILKIAKEAFAGIEAMVKHVFEHYSSGIRKRKRSSSGSSDCSHCKRSKLYNNM